MNSGVLNKEETTYLKGVAILLVLLGHLRFIYRAGAGGGNSLFIFKWLWLF